MRSHLFATRYPNPVFEGMTLRQEQMGYRTMGEFQTSLNRCDQILRPDHDCTKWIAAQSQGDQDFIDDCLKDFTKPIRGSQPSLMHYFCHGIIAIMIVRHHCTPTMALTFLPPVVRDLCVAHGFI